MGLRRPRRSLISTPGPQLDRPTPRLDREAKRRLTVIRHVDQVTGSVAMTWRYVGISWQAYSVWSRRYQAESTEGLHTRSKRPKTSPNATHIEMLRSRSVLLQRRCWAGSFKAPDCWASTLVDDDPALPA
ncbi:leucine zipper domain-containing protein [Actinomadura sp. NPDC048955]|uniref:helix-turn-helix domain-containing protein n=1 Tax=Actinomadura sp. NPDC048955 TaxID=3158228 RepID=UPI00340A9EAB